MAYMITKFDGKTEVFDDFYSLMHEINNGSLDPEDILSIVAVDKYCV